MRFGVMIAAAATMLCAGQANAAETFQVTIGGYVFGTITNYTCTDRNQAFCPVRSEYGQQFDYGPFQTTLAEGANPIAFHIGSTDFFGTIINTNRALTGLNLTYMTTTCSRLGGPAFGCYDITATAPTFFVAGGVPEPATWAMMLAGFGLIGYAMRRRKVLFGRHQLALS